MQQGFDNRIVSYEYIHSIDPEDFKKLIDAVDPQSGEVILDAMCGYGAAGKAIIERVPRAEVYFLDESEVQIERAKENISQGDAKHFIISSLPSDDFGNEFFDKIVLKMGLHEVSAEQQVAVLRELNRILKPTGKVVIWDIVLNDNTQALFQEIIRKKDELSGFDMLTKERYFFREDEFMKNTQLTGFTAKEFHAMAYRFSSRKRLESELGGNVESLTQLNDFIRARFPESLKETMKHEDSGEDIRFTVTKKIFVLKKLN